MTAHLTEPSRAAAPAVASALGALNVLIVDDDCFTHELVGAILRQLGVSRIRCVADGDSALRALGGSYGAPDLVICDLHMPGKDGFQVMEEMAALHYTGAVILLSGMEARVLNSAALMGRFHHLRLLGVVQKPVSRQALVALLNQVQHKG